jgi:hypothetical protein
MPVQRRRRRRRRKPAQQYDSILKELVQERIAELVPILLEGAVFVERLDVERIRPTMRIDSASLIEYEGEPHVLHLELSPATISTSVRGCIPIMLYYIKTMSYR